MRVLRDFKCPSSHITERFIDSEVETIMCECGETATKILSVGTIMLDGTDPGFPSAYDRWARIREDRHRKRKM